jgi:hypothetical protein
MVEEGGMRPVFTKNEHALNFATHHLESYGGLIEIRDAAGEICQFTEILTLDDDPFFAKQLGNAIAACKPTDSGDDFALRNS